MPEPTEEAKIVWLAQVGDDPERRPVNMAYSAAVYRQRKQYQIEEFTCANCPQVSGCSDSFGLFNTDNDCSRTV